MTLCTRFALATALALATAGGIAAQTLTVNKVQETLGGQQLDSTNANVGIPMVYLVSITSSDPNKNPALTVTDTLPAGFVLLTAGCTAQGSATCPASIPFTGNPSTLTINVTVPAGSSTGVVIRMTGYFTRTGQFTNHVEALRSGETTVENTAKVDATLTINDQPLPVDLQVTKTVTPTTGSTGTNAGTGTTYTYTVTVKNNSASDVYLGGFKLTDFLRLLSGSFVNFQLSNFTCSDPACPTLPAGPTGFVGSSTPAFSLPWSTSSLLQGNASFVLTFDATFNGVTCGTGSSVIRNDIFLALGNAQTSIGDTNPANNTGMATLTSSFSLAPCQQPPSLAVSKVQVSPANPVAWGVGVTYQISFTNNTGAALTNLNVSDFLAPSSAAPGFQATIAAPPACSPACTFGTTTFPAVFQIAGFKTLFTASFASIPDGQAVTITFTVQYDPPPCATSAGMIPITNEAQAQSGQIFGFDSVTTLMQALPNCGLTVKKNLTTANPVVLGQPVEFQITYTNPFPQAVTVHTLEDVLTLTSSTYGDLPIQIQASSCQATGSVSPLPTPVAVGTTSTVKFNNPPWSGLALLNVEPVTFASGASLTCTIRFVPQQPTGCQGTGNPQLFNSAFIDTGFVNTNSGTQPPVFASASADLPLCRSISIKKTAPIPQSFTPGQIVTYTVRVTNNNPNDPVAGVHVTDPLPPGFTYVSSSCTACSPAPTFAGGVLQASIPTIPANGFVVVTIVVKAPPTGGSYDNSATAGFDQQGNFFAGPGTALSSTANVQVLTPRLTKAFSQPAGGPSGPATLTFTLANVPGNPLEQGITFTDTLTPGFHILGPASTTCTVGTVTIAGNAITFQGELQAGEATCTVTVPVTGAGCNDRSNVSNTNNIDPSNANAMLNVTECPPAGGFDPQIPTLSPWGLIAMALLLAGLGLVRVWGERRRT